MGTRGTDAAPAGHGPGNGPRGGQIEPHQDSSWQTGGYDGQRPAGASRLRITAAVFALIFAVLGIFEVLIVLFSRPPIAPSTPFVGWMNFLLLVGSVGSLVTGIVLLAKQRRRGGATPWLVAAFGVVGALGAFLIPFPTMTVPGTVGMIGLASVALCGLAVRSEQRTLGAAA